MDKKFYSQGINDVVAERIRQIQVEGFTIQCDQLLERGKLAQAANAYIEVEPEHWPFEPEEFKPSDYRRNLVKAAALIIAELDRLDVAALASKHKVQFPNI